MIGLDFVEKASRSASSKAVPLPLFTIVLEYFPVDTEIFEEKDIRNGRELSGKQNAATPNDWRISAALPRTVL